MATTLNQRLKGNEGKTDQQNPKEFVLTVGHEAHEARLTHMRGRQYLAVLHPMDADPSSLKLKALEKPEAAFVVQRNEPGPEYPAHRDDNLNEITERLLHHLLHGTDLRNEPSTIGTAGMGRPHANAVAATANGKPEGQQRRNVVSADHPPVQLEYCRLTPNAELVRVYRLKPDTEAKMLKPENSPCAAYIVAAG